MDRNKLAALVHERMRKSDLSTREAAKEVDVAHTTICRILQGETVSLETLAKVSKWLQVDPGNFIAEEDNSTASLASYIATVIETDPRLEQVFREAMEKMISGEISMDVIREIINYASWRINEAARQKEGDRRTS